MVGRIRDFVDSRLHPLRRRRALEALRDAHPRKVLFVCTGNICRSPFAAALFAKRLPDNIAGTIVTTSAGFVGPGRSSPLTALETARDYGIDMSDHRSAALTSENLRSADLIVVMSREQEGGVSERAPAGARVIVLGDLDPLPIKRRTILDPWEGPRAAFDESYARIDRCIAELVKALI